MRDTKELLMANWVWITSCGLKPESLFLEFRQFGTQRNLVTVSLYVAPLLVVLHC